jgi:membrane protein
VRTEDAGPPTPAPGRETDRELLGLGRLRRHAWIDHLVRAAVQYLERHGDHYAAAITYFSVVALVPLLMVAFAVAGYVLLGDPALLADFQRSVVATVGPGLAATVEQLVAEALRQSETVGVLGLVLAVYTGLAWMYRVREALSAQWSQRTAGPPYLAGALSDTVALLGLAVVLAVALGTVALGDVLTGAVAGDGADGFRTVVATTMTLGFSLAANLLILVWVIARLPRERLPLRRAVRPALLAAVGVEVIQRVGAVYLGWVTGSPAGLVFGPVLGLLVAIYLGSRLVLFATAWAATSGEAPAPDPAPPRP